MDRFLAQLSDSHRMLLKLIKSRADEYTMAERKSLLAACEGVQEMIDVLMGDK